MGSQQAVAKRSVGRRVTHLTRLFFSSSAALCAYTLHAMWACAEAALQPCLRVNASS